MDHKNIKHKNFMLVISSPSGVGKTTICRMLLESEKDLVVSVSATTRKMRRREVQGEDYYFITKEQFNKMIEEGQFLEHAKVFKEQYGTPKQHVDSKINEGKNVLFDIDWQGAQQLNKQCEGDVVTIFLLPPSMDELEKRLNKRNLDAKEVIKERLEKASTEISHWDEYQYVLVNENLEETAQNIRDILKVEKLKRQRQLNLDSFVSDLINYDSSNS